MFDVAYCTEKSTVTSEISGSQGGECEEGCLLRCRAVQSNKRVPTFQSCFQSPSLGQLRTKNTGAEDDSMESKTF
jgi:hypothetical protein